MYDQAQSAIQPNAQDTTVFLEGEGYLTQHIIEFKASALDPELVALNVTYLEGDPAVGSLLWGLEGTDRTNPGTARETWIKSLHHVRKGGLAFYGVDPLTGERTDCLSFKPVHPLSVERKYESPRKAAPVAIYPAVTHRVWQIVSNRFNVPLPVESTSHDSSKEAKEFWSWVIEHNIPVVITEGAKKALSAMSHGYPTIGLTGLWNWTNTVRDENGKTKEYQLIPSLLPLATTDRVINIALDRDRKASTNKAIIQSRSQLAKCLIDRGSQPFSIVWDADYKGLDDLIAQQGIEAVERSIEAAVVLTGEQPNFKQKPSPNILAEKIAKELSHKLLFDVGGKLWRFYSDGVWYERTIEEIERYFYERVCLDVPENIPSYIENVVKVAKWKLLQPIWNEVSGLEFIPFKNGVWDVKNRKLLPHHPNFLLTWKLTRDYPTVAGLEFPSIDRFLTQVTRGNHQLKNILIAACNAVLLGRSDLQKAIYLVGGGSNGKGSYLRLLEMLVGLTNCHSTTLHDLCENNFELANIYKKRLIICPDEDKRVGGLSRFKSITGGDSIRGEKKGKDAFRFRYEGMVAIASNDPIFLGDSSYGLSRRLITIPFKYQVPTHERRDLTAEFEVDLPAFTSYLLSLDEDTVKSILLGSSDVAEIRETEWDLTTRTDSIAAFYDDSLIFDPTSKTPSSELYRSYKEYCVASGLSAKSLQKFIPDLVELCSTKLGLAITKGKAQEKRVIIGLRFRLRKDSEDSVDSVNQLCPPPSDPFPESNRTVRTVFTSIYGNKKEKEKEIEVNPIALEDKKDKDKQIEENTVHTVLTSSVKGFEHCPPHCPTPSTPSSLSNHRLEIGTLVRYVGGMVVYQGGLGKITKFAGGKYETSFTTKGTGSCSRNELEVIE